MVENSLSCRGCLAIVSNYHPLKRPEIKELFVECTAIQITDDQPDLPQQICPDCYAKCEQWKAFRTMCHGVNLKLQETVLLQPKEERVDVDPDPAMEDVDLSLCTLGELVPDPVVQNPVVLVERLESPYNFGTNPKQRSTDDCLCPVCSSSMPDMSSFKNHFKEHYSDQNPQCPICKDTFTRGSKVYTHIISVHMGISDTQHAPSSEKEPFPHLESPDNTEGALEACPLCNTRCAEMGQHIMVSHVPVGTVTCPICSKQMRRRADLKRHLLVHTKEKSLVCNLCPKKFSRPIWLETHVMKEHDRNRVPGTYKCPLCVKVFDLRCLRRHFVVHTKERPYQCTYCQVDFTVKGKAAAHIRLKHKDKPVEEGLLVKEDSIFHNPNPWEEMGYVLTEEHTNDQQTEDTEEKMRSKRWPKRPCCLQCKKMFLSTSECKEHILQTHEKRKTHPFECGECGNSFEFKGNLRLHLRSHSNKRNFVCTICGYAAKFRCNLKSHISKVHRK